MWEQSLSFIGILGLSDIYTEGAEDFVHNCSEFGSNLWVLTGDKAESTINMARQLKIIKHLQGKSNLF